MSKGAVDALRVLREQNYILNQRRMREDIGKTVDRPKAIAKKAVKKRAAKIGRKRG